MTSRGRQPASGLPRATPRAGGLREAGAPGTRAAAGRAPGVSGARGSGWDLLRLREETGVDTDGLDFLSFTDLEQSVRRDVERVRASALIPGDATVSGFVYEVESGRLREVA